MNGTLQLNSNILAYGDQVASSNPARRFVDWTVKRTLCVSSPKAVSIAIDPGATISLFSGQRTTGIGSGTEFVMTLSTLAQDRYRFTWDSTGSNPTFRTDRGLTLSTHSVVMTANGNQSLTMAATAGDFAAVVIGDTIFIPGISTGDAAGPFSDMNTGNWLVMSKSGDTSTLQLSRPVGTAFVGVTETVTVTANSQVVAFSATGVQLGDAVNINAGFSAPVLGTYAVAAITPTWFEIIATQPLPITATAVPGATGIVFYTDAKRYLRIEADQVSVVRLNGDSGNSNALTPFAAGDPDGTAWFEKTGPIWSATVVNGSTQVLNLLVISAE